MRILEYIGEPVSHTIFSAPPLYFQHARRHSTQNCHHYFILFFLRLIQNAATTGRPHTGYFVAALKIAQLLAAGCDVTVLLADIHGFLDNLKAPIELVENRAKYYDKIITAILKSVGVSTEKLRFVLGSSYQKSPECKSCQQKSNIIRVLTNPRT